MSEPAEPRPEGRLIAAAQKRSGISQRQAAARAGISENHWRNIVKGYSTVSAGVRAPIRGPADTVARMARVVGVTPEELEAAGRTDAAAELRDLPPAGPEDQFDEDIAAAHAVLDGIERDPRLRDRLRKILSIASGHGEEPDNPDTEGDSGTSVAG